MTVSWRASILKPFYVSHGSSLFPLHFLVENGSLTRGQPRALVCALAASLCSKAEDWKCQLRPL